MKKKQARVSCAVSSTPASAARGIKLHLSLDQKEPVEQSSKSTLDVSAAATRPSTSLAVCRM